MGEPIDVPVTADAKRLLPRLMASGLSERDILPAFHQLTLEPCFGEVGACLRENLPTRVIEVYYKEQLLPYERREGTLYLDQRSAKEYLELGLDFRALLNIDGMKRLWGRKVSDLAFSEFVKVLHWSALKNNSKVVEIDRWYPSSKTCHVCGFVNDSLSLTDREWVCPSCGAHLDRDVNAAINIHVVGAGLKST